MENKLDIPTISKQTGISIRELNRLNRDLWYHGTTIANAENISRNGVIADYNLGSELDFGPGFYLTDTYARAASYISRSPIILPNGSLENLASWAIIEFKINPYTMLFQSQYNFSYYNFPKHNEDFAKFVLQNRTTNCYNQNPHKYDLVWGVMSDNHPNKIVYDYNQGVLSYEESIKLLQKSNSMKQLFLGNQSLCDKLIINNIFTKEAN